MQNVPDVDAFPGHIACSALSKSELVIPLISAQGEVLGVLDIDSEKMAFFNDEDEQELSALMDVLLKSSGL